MSTLAIAVGLLGLVGVVLVVVVFVPAASRRGVTLGLVLVALFGATSDSVPNSVSQAVQIVCAVLLVIALVGAGRGSTSVRPSIAILVCLVVTTLVVTVLNFPAGDLLAIRLALLAVLSALVASRFSRDDLAALLHIVIALAVVEVGLGILEVAVTHQPIPWGYKTYADGSVFDNPNPLLGRSVARVQGTTGHPIPFAVVMALGLAALAGVWRSHGTVYRLFVLAACSAGLLLSGSRSVFLAVAIAGVYLLVTSEQGGRTLRIVVASFAIAIAAILFAAEVADAVTELVGSGSYTNRSGALQSVPALLGRPPLETLFGNGIGNQLELYGRGLLPQDGFFVVDNQLVSSLGSTGVVGAVLTILLFVVGFRRAGRPARAFVLILAVMVFSFDYFVWVSLFTTLAAMVAMPPTSELRGASESVDASVGPPEAARAKR